jgi:coenzyme F420-reducing hydrogenase delta subunit
MFFMSGSQAHAFAIAAQTMTNRVRELGPNPLRRPGREPAGTGRATKR